MGENICKRINEFCKVSGYKINIQKSVAFLHTKYKLFKREIKETIPFTITSKRIKCLGINLTKEVKDPYLENSKTLMKKLKMTQTHGKIHCVHGLEELILLKLPYCLGQSTGSMQSLSKYQGHFSQNYNK